MNKIFKAQPGTKLEPYSNPNPINAWVQTKINNTPKLYHFKQSIDNFKDTPIGSIAKSLIPTDSFYASVIPISRGNLNQLYDLGEKYAPYLSTQ